MIIQLNTTVDVVMYALFPGQRIFVGTNHPQQPMSHLELKGSKTFLITITPSFTVFLPEKSDCILKEDNTDSILQVHLEYEQW